MNFTIIRAFCYTALLFICSYCNNTYFGATQQGMVAIFLICAIAAEIGVPAIIPKAIASEKALMHRVFGNHEPESGIGRRVALVIVSLSIAIVGIILTSHALGAKCGN